MSRSNNQQVLVVIGAGGMGLATARRVGGGRVILLADIKSTQFGCGGRGTECRRAPRRHTAG